MTSYPASRRARATIFAPRSWPSRPGLAITIRYVSAMSEEGRRRRWEERSDLHRTIDDALRACPVQQTATALGPIYLRAVPRRRLRFRPPGVKPWTSFGTLGPVRARLGLAWVIAPLLLGAVLLTAGWLLLRRAAPRPDPPRAPAR